MADTMATLRTLDLRLDQAGELRSRLIRGPRVLAASDADLVAVKARLADAEDRLRRTQMASHEKSVTLKQRETRLADLAVKLNMASKNTEYQAIKDQIAADKAASDVLSDEILELLERTDEIAGEIRQIKELLATKEADRKRLADHIDGERATLQADLARVEGQIVASLAEIPADVRVVIQQKMKSDPAEALAQMAGGGCGNCHSSLTPNRISQLSIGTPIVCESCGAVVYRAPDRAED